MPPREKPTDAMPTVKVHFLPELATSDQTSGSAVVVIDVLRATTTITYALAAGASKVVPCLEVGEARQVARMFAPGAIVLGGERNGVRIEGFALGNSPCEYTQDQVGGRTLLFTTTNGTKAMTACRRARRIVLGAFVNLSAVASVVRFETIAHLVCAGTRGEITREDVLLAGAVVDQLESRDGPDVLGNDQARIARDAWRECVGAWGEGGEVQGLSSKLEAVLADSLGGRNLANVGLARDLADVAKIDAFDVVPELDPARWSIRI